MHDETKSSRGPSSPGVPSSSTLEALRELIDLSAQVGPVIARRADLSHSELTALELLMTRDQGPGQLARQLGVTSAASSGIVDRLVARGHAVREPDASDGRRTTVVITDAARAEVIGHLMPMFLALKEIDDDLADDERIVVERFLRRASDAVRRLL